MYKIRVLVQCPHCGARQKYGSYKTKLISGKVRKCVKCPKSFTIRKENIIKRLHQ